MALQIEPGASGGIHTRTSIYPHAAGDVLSLICMDSAVNEYVWCFTIQHRSGPGLIPACIIWSWTHEVDATSPISVSFHAAACVLRLITRGPRHAPMLYALVAGLEPARCVWPTAGISYRLGVPHRPIYQLNYTNTAQHCRSIDLHICLGTVPSAAMLLRVSPGLPPGRRTSAVAVSSSGIGKPKESSAFTRADHAMNREMAGVTI